MDFVSSTAVSRTASRVAPAGATLEAVALASVHIGQGNDAFDGRRLHRRAGRGAGRHMPLRASVTRRSTMTSCSTWIAARAQDPAAGRVRHGRMTECQGFTAFTEWTADDRLPLTATPRIRCGTPFEDGSLHRGASGRRSGASEDPTSVRSDLRGGTAGSTSDVTVPSDGSRSYVPNVRKTTTAEIRNALVGFDEPPIARRYNIDRSRSHGDRKFGFIR